MKKALLVIDYTNDFVADDGALTCGKAGQDIEDSIVEKIKKYDFNKNLIFVINDCHNREDITHPESKLYPPHNIVGTYGREVYGKVGEEIKNVGWVLHMDKYRYSAFHLTLLRKQLEMYKIKDIELCGVCTDICILHTAVDAYNLGYNVTVDSKCVASFNQVGHKWALGHFENILGFEVL